MASHNIVHHSELTLSSFPKCIPLGFECKHQQHCCFCSCAVRQGHVNVAHVQCYIFLLRSGIKVRSSRAPWPFPARSAHLRTPPGVLATRKVSGAEATPCNLCRQMFVNHRLAKVAAEKELQEAQARINVQQQLATAQAQVGSTISIGMHVDASDLGRCNMKLTVVLAKA